MAEIDSYLEQNPTGNRRNGYSKKTVKSAEPYKVLPNV
ncbi:hypothetical protein ENHY17A_30233 [Moraxellaceae bacterium 17A]|nr:hypothetical protein ENHY17A_30233 [Moraxellaceae bacterium 17A]